MPPPSGGPPPGGNKSLGIVIAILVALVVIGGGVAVFALTRGDNKTSNGDPVNALPQLTDVTSAPTLAPSTDLTDLPTTDLTELPTTDLTELPTTDLTELPTTDLTGFPTGLPTDGGPSEQQYVSVATAFVKAAASGDCDRARRYTSDSFNSTTQDALLCQGSTVQAMQDDDFTKHKIEFFGTYGAAVSFDHEQTYVSLTSQGKGQDPVVDFFLAY